MSDAQIDNLAGTQFWILTIDTFDHSKQKLGVIADILKC